MLSFVSETLRDVIPIRTLLIEAFGGTGEADLVEVIWFPVASE